MSWLFSQALVEAHWPLKSAETKPSAPLSVMPTQHKFLHRDKLMEPSQLSQFGLTCEVLTENAGEALLTAYLAASPARTYPLPAAAKASPDQDQACGEKWPGSLARFDPNTCELKTAQHSLFEDSAKSLLTLPRWGTWDATGVWEQEQQIQYVKASGSGLSLLRPTAQCWKAWTFKRISSLIRKNHADGNIQEQSARCFHKMITPLSNEILMQWPEGWTDLKPLETDKFQQWLQWHGDCSVIEESA